MISEGVKPITSILDFRNSLGHSINILMKSSRTAMFIPLWLSLGAKWSRDVHIVKKGVKRFWEVYYIVPVYPTRSSIFTEDTVSTSFGWNLGPFCPPWLKRETAIHVFMDFKTF